MENETSPSREGHLEPLLPGSVTFDDSILEPLRNNYLYKESRECFTYNFAYLINNTTLQQRYAAFRAEKQEKGYSDQELEESFGFLLFDDANRAKNVGKTGLSVGQAKCTTLGDSLKGVYISKYSDCLDQKRWYDGKTGYIIIFKITKGRVKEVTDNYTQNFTPPTSGFDCHISEQLHAVSSTTSSFLAYERAQYYMYEIRDGSSKTEPCPRHVCPFAIVAFSYGKSSTISELEEKSQEKTVFHYQPWIGQLKIESAVYDVGLQSTSGAWFPAKLPKTVKIDHAIGVSELKRTLPREIFETSLVGEVCIDGRCFNLYDVVSSEAKNDLAQITQELKEKDMALVIPLDDSGFLILLHSSHLFSYEDAKAGKAEALQGMFIFPDSRAVPRDTKCGLAQPKVSTDVMHVIPALNYAETEMEKCPSTQQGAPRNVLEKQLQSYATLIHPGLLDIPTREASMFPDQYDVPGGFTLIAPKWTQETGTRLKSYFDEPCGFTIPVVRALELLAAGRQQRGDEHDDDIYYCIPSPDEPPQMALGVTEQTETVTDGHSASDMADRKVADPKDEHKHISAEQPQPALQEVLGTPGTAIVTVADNATEYPNPTVSPKLGDVPTEHCVSIDVNVEKTSQFSTEGCGGVSVDSPTKDSPIHTSTPLTISKEECDASGGIEENIHPEKTMTDPAMKEHWRSLPRRRGRKRKMHWKTMQAKLQKELALQTSSLPQGLPENATETVMKDLTKDQIESDTKTESLPANNINQRPHLNRGRGRRRRGVNRYLSKGRQEQAPFESTALLTSESDETIHEQSMNSEPLKTDWRSLPRRKKLWNTDVSLKRFLRSDTVKTSDNDSLSGEASFDATDGSLSSAPKRKMEGLNMRERYGLKNIITECGRVFVPHGSDVASGDAESLNNGQSESTNDKEYAESSIDTNTEIVSPVENKCTEIAGSRKDSPSTGKEKYPSKHPMVNEIPDTSYSPSKDKPSVHSTQIKPLVKHHKNHQSNIYKCQQLPPEELQDTSIATTSNEAALFQDSKKDHSFAVDEATSPPKVPELSMNSHPKASSPEKIKKKSKHVYSAISISKLKTVLRRGRKTKSPSTGDNQISELDNAEPVSKKGKSGFIMDQKLDNIRNNELKDKRSHSISDESHQTSLSEEGHESMKTFQTTKQPGSWRGLIRKSSKENGSLNFDTSAPYEIVNQADQQLTGDRVGRTRISSDGKGSTERLTTATSLPSDALSLLADLALGASNDKILGNQEAKPGQKTPAGVKGDGSPESVLHALLRCPTSRFKLPPRSPFPEGLLVTGELILEISKEHSYSQPTSLLSGLSGPCPQVPPQIGCVESPLSLKTGLHLNLPRDTVASFYQEEGGKTEWKSLISPNMPFQSTKTKTRRSRILRDRQIMDKKGSIEVTRIWRETYEFKYDSKFTNDSLDKTVTRALHGKWNFNIEDTYEEVHLIFHMWIGLFYSKTTSRLFHLENSTAFPKRKESAEVQQDIDSLSNAELNSKQSAASALRVPEVLDLSVKNSEPVNLQSVLKDTRDEIASNPGVASAQKLDTAPRHSPSGTSPSPGSHPIASLMNYRSAVDILKENSVPENEDDIDEENDTTADCSYTQLLEGNSAYNQLCEHTSNMTISIRQCVPMAKIINVSKNKAPIRMTTFEAKEIGVFHQVISPIKPSAFSKRHGLILGRKSFELNFMDKIENAAPLTLEQENMSENAENKVVSDAHRTQDSCPVTICDGNVGKTIEIKTKEVVQTENISETKDKKVVSDDDSQDGLLKTGRNGENVEKNTMSEISCKEQTSITDHSSDHTSDAKGKPFLYLDDQTNMSDHVDELKDTSSHETGVEEQNEIVELNTEEELKPFLDLKGHSNEAIDEERDVSSHDVEGNNTKEHMKKGVEYSTNEEKMQEEQNIKQSKSQEETKPDGKHSECEISTTMVEHLDESVMGLNDEISSDSMEISDEDVDNTAQIEVHEANTSNIEVFPAEPLIQKSETQPKTPEVHHVEANTEDDAHKEPNNIPCPSVVKHKSASTLDTYNVIKYGVDRMNLEQSIVVQEGVHDICQDESETESNNNLEISNLEEAEERDISQQDAAETISDDTHGNEAQTQMSDIHEDKTQVIYTFQNFQKPEFPKMCASPPVCTNLYDKNLAQQASAVCRSSEVKENSNCSTPTQDEIPYDLKVNKAFVEVSNFKDDSNRDLKCINNMIDPGVTMLSPKSPLSPRAHVCTKLPVSNTIEHCKEAHSKEPGWRRSKYPSTSDFDKFTSTTEHSVPHQFRHKLYSTSQHRDDGDSNFIDGTTQDDSELFYRDYDSGHLHGYYHKCPSDQGVLWTDGKTDGSDRHRGSYPCEKDSDDDSEPPFHYMYNTSEFGDDSYWQKKVTEKDTFKCQTKVTTAAKYGNTIEILERDRTLEKSSRNNKSTGTFYCKREWNAEDSSDCIADYSIKKTSHFKKYRTKPTRTVTVNSTLHDGASKQRFDWRRYFRREATFRQLFETNEVNNKFDMPPSSIVTIFDKEGNRVTYENSPTMKTSTGTNSRTIKLENSLNHWRNQQSKADVTRSAVDYEYLIFSEKLNGILKESKRSFSTTSHFRSNTDHATLPMTVRFSDLEEQESSIELSKAQTSLTEFKIKVDLSNKKVIREPLRNNKPFHLQRLFCEKGNEVECSRISEIAEQCASSYKSMMNDICAGKTLTHQSEAIKWKWSQNEDSLTGRQQSGFCGPIKKDMFDCLHNNLNSVVRQACKTKYRFYILVTSADPFFEETKNLLVIEGHIPVEPDEFNLNDNRLSPLLIILRNEDIAQHICEVPYLLELKKSSCVQFAGIDRPDDVVNLTHQELFAKGGYVVCDGTALDKLTLDNMKKVVGILEELDKKGKWKWFLHYKDSRKLRENARSSYEASKKQNFIDCCQEAGLVEVLPYHDCDVISREQPDYLSCLIRLQIQNASVRFPVFITDTPADSFGKNGILTMNIYTFSRILSNDTCSVS